jgi:hypothetical protein
MKGPSGRVVARRELARRLALEMVAALLVTEAGKVQRTLGDARERAVCA